MKSNTNKRQNSSTPRYAIRKDLGCWELTFEGRHAVLKHEQGATYVAHLLLNPPNQPIHALDLVTKLTPPDRTAGGVVEITNPATGARALLEADARLQERSPALDDARTMRAVLRSQTELEAILEDEDVIEPVKAEVQRDLVALYGYETRHSRCARDSAQKASDAVGRAIKRFHDHLASALDASGSPHPVLRPFADHVRQHLLIPSGRCCAQGGPRPGDGLAGCFTYDPPAGITWTT